METESALYEADLAQTLANRERLSANSNLMHWYGELYSEMFRQEPEIAMKTVLEIGSGTSPLKRFLPNVITSDVLKLDYLDIVFDCHEIARLPDIADHSVDVITMTNVLHHLKDPLAFLRGATRKLAKGGRVYVTEPYLSWLSYPMYKLLHHEPVDLSIRRPVLDTVQGPLSTSNQAMPHMIFFSGQTGSLSFRIVTASIRQVSAISLHSPTWRPAGYLRDFLCLVGFISLISSLIRQWVVPCPRCSPHSSQPVSLQETRREDGLASPG
ncbi:class I SAM-dependent methyltransferase [Rhizobium ruizarguesonis]|uniref:Class I SAM-dependent methyltransferase n=1 Tax=Rhizobium ruizarguesonis TaxID=2081791 RepID=A0ACD5ELV3_9HYPH